MPFDLSKSPLSFGEYQPQPLQLAEGISIFLHHWRPGSLRGQVLLLHGKGDHGGGFVPLAEELAANGGSGNPQGQGNFLSRG